LKVIGEISNDEKKILSIDKELPDSESSRKRKELDEKFLLWKKLYKETLEDENKKKTNFVQMKLLESVFIEKNYTPFMNFIQVTVNSNNSKMKKVVIDNN